MSQAELLYLQDKRDKLCELPEIDEDTQREINRLNDRICQLLEALKPWNRKEELGELG